jgi:hypothetical protein
VSPATYLAELPSLVDEVNAGTIEVKTSAQPLSNVEDVWLRTEEPGVRSVLVP